MTALLAEISRPIFDAEYLQGAPSHSDRYPLADVQVALRPLCLVRHAPALLIELSVLDAAETVEVPAAHAEFAHTPQFPQEEHARTPCIHASARRTPLGTAHPFRRLKLIGARI